MNTEDHFININNILIDVKQFATHETPDYIVKRLRQAITEVLQQHTDANSRSSFPFHISSAKAQELRQQLQQQYKQLTFPKANHFQQNETKALASQSVLSQPSMSKMKASTNLEHSGVSERSNSIIKNTNPTSQTNTAPLEISTSNTNITAVVPAHEALITAIQEKYLDETSPDYNKTRVVHWQKIVEKLEKGEDIQTLIKAPEHIELKVLYTTVVKQTVVQKTLDKTELRKRMITHIETDFLERKTLKYKERSFWKIILEKLKNPSEELLTILNENPKLFLFLDLLTPEFDDFELSLKALLKTNTFVTFRGIYPKLDTKSIYANLGKLRDVTGKGIRKINKNIKGLVHKENEIIVFNVVEPKSVKSLENTNWKIYKKDGTLISTYRDKGATLEYVFSEKGEFVVEAYGSISEYKNGNQYKKAIKGAGSYIAVHIAGPLKGIKLLGQDTLRPGETLRFEPEWHFELETFPILEWTYRFKATKKAKFGPETLIPMVTESDKVITHVFPNKGYYEISACEKGVEKLFKAVQEITVGSNWVVSIKETENKDLKLAHTDARFLFEVDNYRINPATPEEIDNVKWLVFKAGKIYTPKGNTIQKDDDGKPYLSKGARFDVFINEEGEYGIEAYMNGYSKRGKSFAKINVVHPKVTEASWTYQDGQSKHITGLTEDNYIKGKIPYFNSQPIIIDVCQGKTVVFTIKAVTTDKGMFSVHIPTAEILKQLKTLEKALVFRVRGSAYKLKEQEVLLASQLQLTEHKNITAAYFMHKNNKLSPIRNAVLHGTRITFVVETANMVGQKLILALYSAKNVKDYSYFDRPLRTKEAVLIPPSGKVVLEFELQKDWANINRYYYVGIASGAKSGYLKRLFNSTMLLGYWEGDVLPHGAKVYEEVTKKTTVKRIAQLLLEEGRVTFEKGHSSGGIDEANAFDNIKDLAAGNKAKLSDYDNVESFRKRNKHSGETEVSSTLLYVIYKLSKKYTMKISEITGGSHSPDSKHYFGLAVDINYINGQKIGQGKGSAAMSFIPDDLILEFEKEAKKHGAYIVLNKFNRAEERDHHNHFHLRVKK